MKNPFEEDKKTFNDTIDKNSILNRLMQYCAYQERSVADVHKKLNNYKVSEETRIEIMNKLRDEGFVDNRRFAEAYASGKFRNNHWGKKKIRLGLLERQIDENDIENALNEINQDEYNDLMLKLILQKKGQIREKDLFVLRNKIARYLISKGFEPDLVWEIIKKKIG